MPKQEVVEVSEEQVSMEQELALLRGFRDLVAEGLGYYLGAKAITAEAKEDEKVAEARKSVSTIRKEITKSIPSWIENADIKSYQEKTAELQSARDHLKEVMKPYNERKRPLNKAWRYCVNVAFPDALKELGAPVQPRFSLSKWIESAIAKKK